MLPSQSPSLSAWGLNGGGGSGSSTSISNQYIYIKALSEWCNYSNCLGHVQVLGTDKPAKTWEVTVERAEKRMLLYSPPNSPDIMSSIYSVGGSSGLDDYYLPSIDTTGLKYVRASSILESMKNSFNDNDLNLFYTDLLTQDVNSESQLDF